MPDESNVTTEETKTEETIECAIAAQETAPAPEEAPGAPEAAVPAAVEEAAPPTEESAPPTEESAPTTEETAAAPPEPAPPAEDALKTAREAFSRMGLAIAAVLGLGSLGQVLLAWLLPARLSAESWYIWAVTFVPLYLLAFPAGFLLLRAVPAHRGEKQPLSGSFARLIPICICLMIFGNYVGLGVNWLVGRLSGASATNPVAVYASQESLWAKLLCMALLAPLAEELLFRRGLIDRMRPYGERTAAVTSALMFALFHGNLSQFFYAFALGLLFGYLYLRTGRLRWSLLLHMLVNLLGSVIGPGLVEAASAQTGGTFSVWTALYALYTAAMLGLAVAGLVMLLSRRQKLRFEVEDRELPRGKRFRTVWLNPGMGLLAALCLALFGLNIFVL